MMSLRIAVLGELRVARGNLDLTPSQPKVRQLLALLAINHDKVVRIETIVRELWDGEPSEKTVRVLQVYVSRLRQTLGADCTVVHTPKVGYQLQMAPSVFLDLTNFRQLVVLADGHRRERRTADAMRELSRAVDLCRGPVLSDVSMGPVLAECRIRLEALTAATLGRYLRLQLELGRPDLVVEQFDRVTAEDPRYEDAYATLMRALAAVGRRAEALELFHNLRTRQVRETGVEPGPLLGEALHEILGKSQNRGPARQSSLVVPRQLPMPPADLRGLEPQVNGAESVIRASAFDRVNVVAVVGPPGSGSSAFCAHVADRVAADFAGGQLYGDLDERSADDILADFVVTIDPRAKPLPSSRFERVRRFRELTAGRRFLVLLDNLGDPMAAVMLQPSAGGAVLLASRSRQCAEAATSVIDLPRLSSAVLTRLLASWIGPQRAEDEPAAAHRLVAITDGLVLALRQVASLALRRPHWTLSRLAERVAADPATIVPVSSVERSVRSLTESEWRALRLIVESTGDGARMSVDWTTRTLGTTRNAAESFLERLVEIRLADPDPAGPDNDGYCIAPLYRRAVQVLGSRFPVHLPRSRPVAAPTPVRALSHLSASASR